MASQPSLPDVRHLGLIHRVGHVTVTEVQILRPLPWLRPPAVRTTPRRRRCGASLKTERLDEKDFDAASDNIHLLPSTS